MNYDTIIEYLPNPLEDTCLKKLGFKLKEDLNILGNYYYPDQNIVKTVKLGNFRIASTEYPCLKLYRYTDTYNKDNNIRYSRIKLTYGTIYDVAVHNVGLLNFISEAINVILIDYLKNEMKFSNSKIAFIEETTEYPIQLGDNYATEYQLITRFITILN